MFVKKYRMITVDDGTGRNGNTRIGKNSVKLVVINRLLQNWNFRWRDNCDDVPRLVRVIFNRMNDLLYFSVP